MKTFFIIWILSSTALLYAGEFCTLQPEPLESEREWIKNFEKNIEKSMSQIYKNNYPQLSEKIRELQQLNQEFRNFETDTANRYIRKPRKHHRASFIYHREMRNRRKEFLKLLDQDFNSAEGWGKVLKQNPVFREVSFEEYQNYRSKIHQFKKKIQELEELVLPIRSPHFLYPPEFDYSIRGGETYGNLKMEVFFRSPKDNLFMLPFLNIGFEMDKNTVIYACLHLDSFDDSKNKLYLYFLSTNKIDLFHWKNIFLDQEKLIQAVLNWKKPPQASITPLHFVLNPTASAVKTIQTMSSRLPFLSKMTQFMDQFQFLNLTWATNLHPALNFLWDNFNFGIKGVLIKPHQLQLRYSAKIAWGLIHFNLAKNNTKADFSSYMNVLTWPHNREETSEE